MINLDALESAARAATPGPWEAFYKRKYDEWHVSIPIEGSTMRWAMFDDGVRTERPEADAKYIAACDPATVLALVRIAKAAAEYEGLRNHPCIDRMTFEQWADIAGQRHAELLAALRDAGLL